MRLHLRLKRGAQLGLACTCALLALGCHGKEATPPPELTRTEQLAPFTEAEATKVQPFVLHKAHAAKKLACAECHASTDTANMATDQTQCLRCHPKSTPPGDVWQGHCLVCHDFTQVAEQGQLKPPPKERCLLCHTAVATDPDIHDFFRTGSRMAFACSSCHQPHKKDLAAQPKTCTVCHGDLATPALLKQGHLNCSGCHSPHGWQFAPKGGCKSCHSQPPKVTVHLIGAHPQDCLKCHSPHFTDQRLKGAQCQTCHKNRTYIAGKNQPKAHLSCANCHNQKNWNFKGAAACASCHPAQGTPLAQPGIPAKHQNCANCHSQHNFRTTFSSTCSKCHDLSKVLEHNLPFHPVQQCNVCHDAHLATRPPKSGDCAGCHGDAVPAFGTTAPQMHLQCENCHDAAGIKDRKFKFVGPEASCQLCHSVALADPETTWEQAPAGHLLCTACHKPHTFELAPVADSCGVCHADQSTQANASGMGDCFVCHSQNHLAKFTGVEASCTVCHAQQAEETAGTVKADCTMCHQQHSFKADAASCTICHTELPGAHSAGGHADCLNCHTLHTFKVDLNSCTVCHTDRAEHFPGQQCTECHKFTTGS